MSEKVCCDLNSLGSLDNLHLGCFCLPLAISELTNRVSAYKKRASIKKAVDCRDSLGQFLLIWNSQRLDY